MLAVSTVILLAVLTSGGICCDTAYDQFTGTGALLTCYAYD